jgi:hypothetical protein
VTLFSGAGELLGDLDRSIRQNSTLPHQCLCPLFARSVPFSEIPVNGPYLQKIRDLLIHQLRCRDRGNMKFHTTPNPYSQKWTQPADFGTVYPSALKGVAGQFEAALYPDAVSILKLSES